MNYLKVIEDAITAAVKERVDAEFQRGVERGRLERRSEELKMEELRRRERSIGAEAELRRIIYDLVGCYSGPSSTTITAGELDARADEIRDAREKGGSE